jgi:hypothetical protein
MAIVQISQIKHRRGYDENLPQLASAELGWSVDKQKLYIGNGSLDEGAPESGNTEILTEHSVIPGLPPAVDVTMFDNSSGTIITETNANPPFYATTPGIVLNYVIQRQTDVRTGYMRISQAAGTVAYDEEYTETNDIGVTLSAVYANSAVQLNYATTSTGYNANLKFTASTFTF